MTTLMKLSKLIDTTLSTRHENGYHDSYTYATYWDVELNKPVETMIWTTAFAMQEGGEDTSTAIDEVLQVYAMYQERHRQFEETPISEGNLYEVTAGRKIKKGTVVRLLKIRPAQKNPWSRGWDYTCLVTDMVGGTHIIKTDYLGLTEDSRRIREEGISRHKQMLIDTQAEYDAKCESVRRLILTRDQERATKLMDTLQSLRMRGESAARDVATANRIRQAMYEWQDNGIRLDVQVARMRLLVWKLANVS